MLYKYLSPDRISVLYDFKIRFSQPCVLNDPFESALLVDPAPYDSAHLLIEAMREQFISENPPTTEEDWEELDEAVRELYQEAYEQMKPHVIGRNLAELINRAQGVLSLSRTNESLLMWAHYADSHRGYVIGLDDSHPFFREKNGLGKTTKPHNVIYTSRRVPVLAGSEEFYEQLLCHKSLEWAYEQEVRIFRTFGLGPADFEKNSHDQIHLFNLPKDCIKEVYIGANASWQTRRNILEIVDRRKLKVDLYEAFILDDRYAIDFRQIDSPIQYRPFEHLIRSGRRGSSQTDVEFSYSYSDLGVPTFEPAWSKKFHRKSL